MVNQGAAEYIVCSFDLNSEDMPASIYIDSTAPKSIQINRNTPRHTLGAVNDLARLGWEVVTTTYAEAWMGQVGRFLLVFLRYRD